MNRITSTMSGLLLVAGLAASADAKTIKLITVAGAPPIATNVNLLKNYFIPEVNKRLAASGDLRIEWRQAYAGSLATLPEVFEAVEEGIAHLGMILTAFEEAKLPLEQISTKVPFGTDDPAIVNRVYAGVRANVAEMDAGWKKHNQVYLGSGASDAFHLVTKFPVRSIDDLKGHKIGASGAWGHMFRSTGATPVNGRMVTAYNDIKNGVYDGYAVPASLAFPYKIYEAAPYFTTVNFGSYVGSVLSVNGDTWADLPKYAREIFLAVAVEWGQRYSKVSLIKAKKFKGIMKKRGATIASFSHDERKRWARAMPNIARQWADARDKQGLPGSVVLKAYMDGLRANGVDVARHWDRE